MARLKPEFDKRSVKAIGRSIDPVDSHKGWAADIKETQGHAPNFPIILIRRTTRSTPCGRSS